MPYQLQRKGHKAAKTLNTVLSAKKSCFKGCPLRAVDYNGGDIKAFKVKSKDVMVCQRACLKHKECVAFTFQKASGICFIKRKGHKAAKPMNTVLSAKKHC